MFMSFLIQTEKAHAATKMPKVLKEVIKKRAK